jgi:long-chain acyl-CoA synthetase
MPIAVAQHLADLGLPILGAYGQTEHLCIAMNRPSRVRFDTVGEPMPGTTVHIADDGELLVARGPLTFNGYWGKAEETRAAFTDDGAWLHTGDRAELAADGTLRITGRIKEMLALSTGRKVAPAPIESALNASPFIAHAVCHGEGRKFLSALLSPRQTVVQAWARSEGIDTPWPALLEHPHVQALFADAVSRVNRDLARTDRVQRFVVIAHELSVEDGTLTPTLKVVRQVIGERFAPLFDAMYEKEPASRAGELTDTAHPTRTA